MKQYIFTIAFLFLTSLVLNGQKVSTWTDVDTLEVYDNMVLVDYVIYSDSFEREKGKAFLYPDSIEIRRSRWLPRFVRKTIPADSMVLHGIVETQGNDGKYRIGKYEYGKKIEMTYYDSNGEKINHQDFYGIFCTHGDPEKGTNRFFIHGTKKKKNNMP